MIRLQAESKPPPQPFIGLVYRGLCLFGGENPQNPIARQNALLNRLAELVDQGDIKHTLTKRIDGLDASALREAHRLVEAGDMIGKVVLTRQ